MKQHTAPFYFSSFNTTIHVRARSSVELGSGAAFFKSERKREDTFSSKHLKKIRKKENKN